jgi:hypothetical protein
MDRANRTAEQNKIFDNFCSYVLDVHNEIKPFYNDETNLTKWDNFLTMAYHWVKHRNEFGSDGLTADQYLRSKAQDIFQDQNLVGSGHSQDGNTLRHTYAQNFGKRVHVGFTHGPRHDEVILSHFTKD